MKLHGSTTSPFVRMCLVTALECGVAERVELVPQQLVATTAHPEVTALSGLGKIPVLETDHGTPVYDSRVIMDYLVHFSGNETLIPHDPMQRYKVLTLEALAMGLADAAVSYRYELASRPESLRWDEYVTRLKQRFASVMADFEQRWQPELAGGHVTVATIAVACALSYLDFRMPEVAWRDDAPRTAGFYAQFAQRSSMRETELGRA